MDRRSKILIGLLVLIVIGVTIWKYDAYITRHDFIVYDHVECDPEVESCFAYICEEGDEECDSEPFKKIIKSAENITLCPNYIEGECAPLSCESEEEGCEEILCSDESVEEGEECTVAEPEEVDTSSSEEIYDEEI